MSPLSPFASAKQGQTEFHLKSCPILNQQLQHSQLPSDLQQIMPVDYTYFFTKFQNINHHNYAFSSTVFTNVFTEQEAKEWLSELQHQTDVTYRVTRGVQIKGQKIIYKTIRHCQHKRKQPLKTPKHSNSVNRRDKKTNCPATLTMKIHNKKHHSRPCEINILWQHNHSIQSAHALCSCFADAGECPCSKYS